MKIPAIGVWTKAGRNVGGDIHFNAVECEMGEYDDGIFWIGCIEQHRFNLIVTLDGMQESKIAPFKYMVKKDNILKFTND